MRGEVIFFLIMVLCGGGISLLLDFFRALRITLKPATAVVAVSDVIFCAAALFAAFACVWNFNSGIFRFYEVVGLVLGGMFYFSLLSKWILRFFLVITENILRFGKFIFKILLTPLAFLYKILVVPIKNSIKNKIRKDIGTHAERIQGQNH